jgi:hypothetical protein
MNFTFGIITGGNEHEIIEKMIQSIRKEQIPEYEIIVVGDFKTSNSDHITIIPFDETIKPQWITRKKNIVTENAKYENVVYMNSYISLESGWYNGFLRFGNSFNLCMNKILKIDGTRFIDWTLHQYDARMAGIPRWRFLLPYDELGLSKFMYFSGSYWVAKKKIMQQVPLDESVCRGEGEDVIWSMQVRNLSDFSMNPYSSVRLLKFKQTAYDDNINCGATKEDILMLKENIRKGLVRPIVNNGEEIKEKIRKGII